MEKRFNHIFFRFILALFIFTSPFIKSFAEWNPFVINYHKDLYGNGRQSWQISIYGDNWMYFANKNGLVEYNGYFWKLFPMHNGLAVRSVLPSSTQKKIYVGGINEFGFFSTDRSGKLIYNCLSDSITRFSNQIRNIWKIHEVDGIIYFQGDSKFIKYYNGKYLLIDLKKKIDCSNTVNGVVYLATSDGLSMLVGNSVFPLKGTESLFSKRIKSILPYQNGMLIVTAYDGIFYFEEGKLSQFTTGAESFLKQNEIFSAAVSKDLLALGTVHNGVLLINKKRKDFKNINETNGLQNNTVLSLAFDRQNNLWAGLDNGIDYLCLNSPFTNLYTFPYTFGTGYTALFSNDILYLGTNRGLYYISFENKLKDNSTNIQQIDGLSGQVWNLCKIKDDVFCLHDRGVYLLKGTQIIKLQGIEGAWNCKPIDGIENTLIVGTYDGIFLLKKANNLWTVVKRIEGYDDSCISIEQDDKNSFWIFNGNSIFHATFDAQYNRIISLKKYGKNNGFPGDKNIRINKLNEKIYFTTPKGIYFWDRTNDMMKYSKELNGYFEQTYSFSRIFQSNKYLMGLNQKGIYIADQSIPKYNLMKIPFDNLGIELIVGAENLIPLNDSLVILPNEYGFALLNLEKKRLQKSQNRLYIQKVCVTFPKDSVIFENNFSDTNHIAQIPFSKNSVKIYYGVSSFNHPKNIYYQYKLNNGEWSDFTNSEAKEYSNLKEGNHTFFAKAILPDGNSLESQYSFRILPPWYRTKIAYIIYLILFLFILFGIYKWDDMRIKRKKMQVAIEKDKELKNLEVEFEVENKRKETQIMELEKEKLEHDLQHKSQEMANLMINLVRKNEILNEIKLDLYKIMNSLKKDESKETKQMLLMTNSKIDSNIQSDDVLKKIEEQFDLIHNNFMQHLQEKYPDLSLNERMMCAYLKMNLSTKEIAPLLNISIRGIETLRYRLRKKFNLGRDENLIDFLNSKI